MSKGLVYVGRIAEISDIPGADRICAAQVVCGVGGRWRGVVPRGQFKEGDQCLVYLPDSVLPQTPEFSFMERYRWRVSLRRFMGVPSECLIMPQTIPGNVGDDVTSAAGVTKYEKPIPSTIRGQIQGKFPRFIPKTDEPNFQSVPELVEALAGHPYYATVKVDGASATAYWYNGHFGCCSRNWELRPDSDNAIWRIAERYRLRDCLAGKNLAMQFEVAGPGIQKNPMELPMVLPFLFNVYDIEKGAYWNGEEVFRLARDIGFPHVEIVTWGEIFPHNVSDEYLYQKAQGWYVINRRPREGIVVRPLQEREVRGVRLSFKVINLDYRD